MRTKLNPSTVERDDVQQQQQQQQNMIAGAPDERDDGVVRQGLLLRHDQEGTLSRRRWNCQHVRFSVPDHDLTVCDTKTGDTPQ